MDFSNTANNSNEGVFIKKKIIIILVFLKAPGLVCRFSQFGPTFYADISI